MDRLFLAMKDILYKHVYIYIYIEYECIYEHPLIYTHIYIHIYIHTYINVYIVTSSYAEILLLRFLVYSACEWPILHRDWTAVDEAKELPSLRHTKKIKKNIHASPGAKRC